jgi:uncharacterized protein YxjI
MFRRRHSATPAAGVAPAGQTGAAGIGRRGMLTPPRRFRMVQRMVAIGDDFFIQDDQGNRVFKVDGKALRVRDTLVFRDMTGNELCRIQQRMLRIKDTMEIEGPHGETLAHVKKALINPIRDRYVVKIGNGPDLEVTGNILDHEFRIADGRQPVAEVSKRWFRIRDSYGVEISPGHDEILVLAATVCIDQMSNPAR